MDDVIFDVHKLKFGDRLIMENGNMAVFLRRENDDYIMVAVREGVDDYYAAYYRICRNRLVDIYHPQLCKYDIIGYWED